MGKIKSTLSTLPLVLAILGIAMAIGGFKNMKLYMSGKVLDFNEATVSDLNKETMTEGNITFVYGPFAILETKNTTYGITTSKHETNYYIVGTYDKASFDSYYEEEEDMDMNYMILQVGDTALQKRLNTAATSWIGYLTSNSEYAAVPAVDINIKGVMAKTSTDVEFEKYLQEAKDDLSNIGITDSQYAKLTLREGELKASSAYGIFFGGVGLAVIGILIPVILLIKRKRSQSVSW